MNINWRNVRVMMLAIAMVMGGIAGLFVIGGSHANASVDRWETVGSAGFSEGEASDTSLYVDGDDGTPYVAYRDEENSGKATVKMYDGSSWETVGIPGFSAGAVSDISLYVDGTPYVAYRDEENSGKATVKMYDGSNWETVGIPGFSAGAIFDISLNVDGEDGIPYVAYRDEANSGRATVMKYNYDEEEWETVGIPGFSEGEAEYISLDIDWDDNIYVAYRDGGNLNKVTVMMCNSYYDEDSDEYNYVWETVGSAGFSEGAAEYISLDLIEDIPYVAYSDEADSGKATVMVYFEDNWEPIGSAGFSEAAAEYISLDIYDSIPYVAYRDEGNFGKATIMKYNFDEDSWESVSSAGFSAGEAKYTSLYVYEGAPYVAYSDGGNSYKATVMKLVPRGSQSWGAVGSAGFSAGAASDTSLYVDGDDGTPYVAYRDEENSGKATVMKYNGSSWELVGSAGFSAGGVSYTSLYVYDGTPYVAYQDNGNSGNATVMMYNGSSWEPVGSAGFSAGAASDTSLYVYDGTPYVAYQDKGNDYNATVMMYNYEEKEWETIGIPGFSAGAVYYTSLYVYDGTPYVAYRDAGNDYKATVMMYDGSNWEPVGSAGISAGWAYNTSLYVYSGIPYVAFQDYGNSSKAVVMKYNDGETNWETVGSTGISAEEAEYTSLYVYEGTPYVAYRDSGNSYKATVMKYNGSSWETVGIAGFSAGEAEYTSLYVYDGTPYVAYRDARNDNKATVMQLKYIVTYDGNGSSEGTVPVDISGYDKNDGVTVLGNTGGLVKTGYTFAGWTTTADGSGTIYSAADMLTIGTADVTLYAKWTVNSSSALLSELSIDQGMLSPSFTQSNLNYNVDLDYTVSSLNLSVMQADPTQTVSVTGAVYQSVTGAVYDYHASGLIVGPNPIRIEVTAQDETANVYTITVNRAASDSGNGGSGGSGEITAPTSSSDKVTSVNGQLTVPAGKSGEVSLGDEVFITIPANATDKELEITIEKVLNTQHLIKNNEVLASSIYEIMKNFTESFKKPVTLILSFEPASLKSNQEPAVFYYDEVNKIWVEVDGGQVNGNHITVVVDHFTKFAVFAVDKVAAVPPTDKEPKINFNDISEHWAEDNIKQAVSAGIVTGYSDGTFKPNQTVTRAEFAVMLIKALNLHGEEAALAFTDTEQIGSWARQAVAQAVQAGIIEGFKDGSFRPSAEITRSEMAAMIANALGQPIASNAATRFSDDKNIPKWAKGAVGAIQNLGLVEGKGSNEFDPLGRMTRAEAVTVLLKMLAMKS